MARPVGQRRDPADTPPADQAVRSARIITHPRYGQAVTMLDRRSAPPHRAADQGTESLRAYAATCASVLGEDLTAYVSGVRTPAELDAWTRPGYPGGPGSLRAAVIRERLKATAELIDAFAAANRVGQLRGWLREVGAAAPGLAPAAAIRQSREDAARKRVHEAAELFLHRPAAAF